MATVYKEVEVDVDLDDFENYQIKEEYKNRGLNRAMDDDIFSLYQSWLLDQSFEEFSQHLNKFFQKHLNKDSV